MSAEHEELENSVAAYALGSADPQDEEWIRAHLDACASCRELAARLSPGVSALALEPEPIVPPARLEKRLLAAAGVRGAAAQPPQRTRRFRLAGPPHIRLRFPARGARLAAAAVLLLVTGTAAGVAIDRLALLTPGAQSSTVEVQRYELTGSGPMTGVQAHAVYLKRDNLTLLDFRYMPQPEKDHVYQLWLITDEGKPISAALFQPASDGSKVILVDRDLKGIKALAVTAEPAPDGSPVPSQTPQLQGRTV